MPGAHRPRAREEESLIDFLKNTEPPGGNEPQALNVGVGAGAGRQQANGNASAANGDRVAAGAIGAAPQSRARVGAARAAREESYRTTSDLADFLRNSGPPGSEPPGAAGGKAAKMMGGADPQPLGRTGSKSGGGMGGKFWRRKATVDA